MLVYGLSNLPMPDGHEMADIGTAYQNKLPIFS